VDIPGISNLWYRGHVDIPGIRVPPASRRHRHRSRWDRRGGVSRRSPISLASVRALPGRFRIISDMAVSAWAKSPVSRPGIGVRRVRWIISCTHGSASSTSRSRARPRVVHENAAEQ
jgi:hypothetical protein